ncbi:MAG: hypothetical protein U0637_07660 [Phycisphaerales bacterium]
MNRTTTDMPAPWPRLSALPWFARLGVACLMLVVLGGLGVSAWHLHDHYENRDESPGLTMTDLEGAYHGVSAPSPLLESLKKGHPETLARADRDALVRWLTADKISENYDNLDLGDKAPSEVMARSCAECHSRKHADRSPIAKSVPLDYWDDIKPIAFSKDIQPGGIKVLVASAHAHSLSLATLALVLSVLLTMTRLPRGLAGLLTACMGLGLLVDIACWFVARQVAGATYLVVLAGLVFNGGCGLSAGAVLIDAMAPRRG